MPPKEYNEHELVKLCLAELCTKTGFLSPESLVQRDLLLLCETIESKTGVSISLSTIKRLLNGQFARLPQIATLDAIAISSGYRNWQDFIITKNQQASPTLRPVQRSKTRYIAWGISLVLAIGLLAIIIPNKHSIGNVEKAKFSVTKVTGNDIPNTVIFKYDIDGVVADSFFIQQSWDQNRRIRIYKNNHTLTDIYYEPGWHNAKLIANDKIIKVVPVSIPTDRWLFYVKDNTPKGEPKYISPANTAKNVIPNLIVSDILSGKIDIQKDNVFIGSYFPSNIAYSSDNFVMKCRVRVRSLNNGACPFLMPEIYCQKYFMYFRSTLKGCTNRLQAQFGENFLSGQTNDLSMLGADLKDWQDMEFRVRDKKVSISINGSKVFSSAYQESCGLITGFGFVSNGLVEVGSLDLTTEDGKNIYKSASTTPLTP